MMVLVDGCSKGNPGAAGAGVVFLKDGYPFETASRYLGENWTCNQAEYGAVILALDEGKSYNSLKIWSDSKLVVNQLNHNWNVNNERLSELYNRVRVLEEFYKNVEYNWVNRMEVTRADVLADSAIIERETREGRYIWTKPEEVLK